MEIPSRHAPRSGELPPNSDPFRRILIAEDHQVSRHLLGRLLSNWGFEVFTASDGEEAAAILEKNSAPPLALLDWMMPKMDGPELCRRVRQHPERPFIYLILLTAKAQKDEVATGLDAGADDYVVKPFDSDELRARLQVGLRVVELERTLALQRENLNQAAVEIEQLKRLLPTCPACKRPRKDSDYQAQVEAYVLTKPDSHLIRGVCPNCQQP